jgi:hypothetical protein
MLAIALLRDGPQELLRALDEPRVHARRREHACEQDGADDETAQLHAPQYTPSIDVLPRRAV